jgi:hypothetical protein
MRHQLLLLSLSIAILAATSAPTRAQQNSPTASTTDRIDSPDELDILKGNCPDIKKLFGCAQELFSGQPVHIAVGSIAPQNGFGAGVAYVGHKTTEYWRDTWNADAVGSINGSWRAGFYMKFVPTEAKGITVSKGTQNQKQTRKIKANLSEMPERPVINLYAQAISLNKLTYFGLGSATTEAARTFYGMREIIVGSSAVKPFFAPLNAAVYGEVNGRFVDIRPSTGQPSPSIEQLYPEATAPGLTTQPGTVQLGEGIRIRPIWANDLIHSDYSLTYQQYVTPSDPFTFQRVTTDLNTQFALYRKTTRILFPRDANGPDECSIDKDSGNPECTVDYFAQRPDCVGNHNQDPECKALSRDLQGSVGFRFFLANSVVPSGNVVPFYFQPTLGGTDINGTPSLASYQDFRFRAPDVMLLRENFEHSIGNLPLGVTFMADQGKVGFNRSDLGSSPWLHSYSAGLTLRAGGFPQVFLLFSWGGKEGTHTTANVNTSLLGGSARPSLF